jgi:hypothetical protein
MKKIIILFLIFSNILFASKPVYKVIMSKYIDKKYSQNIYKKSIVLMTEARLFLQKKYKKKIVFEYTDELKKSKKDVFEFLKSKKARFYVNLIIDKKKSKKNLEKVFYNLRIFDAHSKRFKTVKTKAIIKDKSVVKISQGNLKSSAKKIAKILKKR